MFCILAKNRYVIFYNGIELNHVILPLRTLHYVYTEIEAVNSKGEKETRYFWDDVLLSNTPLSLLISEHLLFWKNKLNVY